MAMAVVYGNFRGMLACEDRGGASRLAFVAGLDVRRHGLLLGVTFLTCSQSA